MTKVTSHVIFLGGLPTILVFELNFGSDELLSGREIAFLYIPLAVAADSLFVKMFVSPLVLLSKVNLSSL